MSSSKTTPVDSHDDDVGILIDFAGEENIPFPSQLMTAAEVDDTFGIFEEKQHTLTTPNTGTECLSPALVHQQLECSFKMPTPLVMSEKLTNKSISHIVKAEGQKSFRKSAIGVHQVLAGSSSMLGLNQAFIRSTGSDSTVNGDIASSSCLGKSSGSSTSTTSDFNAVGRTLPGQDDSVFISPITTDSMSTKENNSSDESGLLEVENLSTFTISDCDVSTTPSNESSKKSKFGSESSIFSSVFHANTSRKSCNEAIAKKVQEIFDAASPSKNPNLFNGSNHLSIGKHHFTPHVRKSIIPTNSKQSVSLYATPKRETPRQFTPIQRENETCFRTPSTPPRARQVAQSTPKQPVRLFPTPMNEVDINGTLNCSMPLPSPQKFNLSNSRLRTPTKLSFSSASSSSGDGSVKKLVKAFPGPAVPKMIPKIQSIQAPRLRFTESEQKGAGKGPQPLKAIPMQQFSGGYNNIASTRNPNTKESSIKSSCASAPVHRKFIRPIAASSPKANTSFSIYEAGTPPKNKRLSNVRSSGYGQNQPPVTAESSKRMNSSRSRVN